MNLKIIAKAATLAGIVAVVIAIIAATVTYELIGIAYYYYPSPPLNYIELSILSAMLPYLFYAIIAFLIAAFASRAARNAAQEQAPMQEIPPQSENAPTEASGEQQNTES